MSDNMKEVLLKMALRVVENAPAIAVLVFIAYQQQTQINNLIEVCIKSAAGMP